MSIDAELPPAVHQGTSWKASVLFGLAAFFLTTLAVQLWGEIRAQVKAHKAESVTAVVEQCSPVSRPANSAAAQISAATPICSKTAQCIKAQVTAPEMLRQAWQSREQASGGRSNGTLPAASAVEKFCKALEVEVEETPTGGKRLRLTLAWPNAAEAAELLKNLGEQFADRYRTANTSQFNGEYNAAKLACEQARAAYDDAVAELEFFQEYENAAQLGEGEAPVEPHNTTQPLRDNSDVENPAWNNLQKDLAALREKQMRLLEKRTAQHPEVLYLDDQIRDRERRLAQLPHWIHADVSPLAMGERPGVRTGARSASDDAKKAQFNAAAAEWLAQLENDVQSTATAYREAVAREQAASKLAGYGPTLAVHVQKPQMLTAATPVAPRPFCWWAGVVMAFAVGLIHTGKSIDPPLGTVEELSRVASVAIVGVVPSYDPTADPQDIKSRMTFLKMGFVFGGVMVMGLCGWMVMRNL